MKTTIAAGLALVASLAYSANGFSAAPPAGICPIGHDDVVWDSPSADSRGSMPLGNGDLGLNVWVESSGDLCFLIGKTDAWDENQRLLKLGLVRVKLTPALVQPDQPFSQRLDLASGRVVVRSGDVEMAVWVDANHPVADVEVRSLSGRPLEASAAFELWRQQKRPLGGREYHSTGFTSLPAFSWPDTVLPLKTGRIGWYHRNVESPWLASLKLQKEEEIAKTAPDPILNRTAGVILRGENFAAVSASELKTVAPAKELSLHVHVLTRITETPEAWLAAVEAQADTIEKLPAAARYQAHVAWWQGFWGRSWIRMEETAVEPDGGMKLLANGHPWRLGMDSTGASRFGGEIAGAQVIGRALSAAEIAALAAAPRPAAATSITGADAALTNACTLAAWIKPTPGETGRILDKCTAGRPDGFTFDTYPGLSLRWIAGEPRIIAANCLQAGEWQHVAATVDANGRLAVYRNGKRVQQSTEEDSLTPARRVSRAYALQRFLNACGGRGAYPIKFNGSIFTCETGGFDFDFRLWGGCYWFQNTRLTYWAMLESGDADLMRPFFDLYRNVLPVRQVATRNYYGHNGAFFPETMSIWGNYTDQGDLGYGTNRQGKPDGMTDNAYVRRYWQGGLELVTMMLDYYDQTQDADFRDQTLLPVARDVVTFFDEHWKRGPDGKILFDPAQSLETWHSAKNPLPEIAGLRYVIPRLLALPAEEATKAAWRKTLNDLPPVPVHQDGKGNIRLAPAETYGNKSNMENPELYAVFPFRLYTVFADAKALETALNTWKVRRHPEDQGWQQNVIQAPMLGLAKEAQAMVVRRAAAVASGYRFPGFFGPNYDWTPDQDHPSCMCIGLQRMLMQCEGDRILLLPAWPKEWNASFKLHAPKNTTVQARVENGEIKDLIVTPASRRQDVEVRTAQ